MFNCYSKPGTVIEFVSNPPLPDESFVTAVQDPDTGTVRNVISKRPKSNASLLEGLHFDEATDGLRARLNLGVPLREVPLLDINGDPLDFLSVARKFSDSAQIRYEELKLSEDKAQVVVPEPPIVEPPIVES